MKNELTALRLREALADNNMKSVDLANKAGVTKGAISQYYNGTCAMGNLVAKKLGHILGVNPMWLMGFDVPKVLKEITDYSLATKDAELLTIFHDLSATDKERLVEMAKLFLQKPQD